FFHQYHRVYSPISFGKKSDKNGDFIRHFIPVLKEFPAKYIYEPWNAPEEVQQKAGCIIGKDYPAPIVDHNEARRANLDRMKAAFATSSTVRKRKLEANDEPSRKRAKK
ncbi:MAG: FAD-binding domain-containing protein, partial [Cytophagales bacterium]|nr:FAD-binding domain-containing protein [Cytophagales bacterium]